MNESSICIEPVLFPHHATNLKVLEFGEIFWKLKESIEAQIHNFHKSQLFKITAMIELC